jgi:ribose-phosphate pyrophosphokinase
MKTLNLVYPEKSEIKYKIYKFPDGQQNIELFTSDWAYKEDSIVQIKSRLNNFNDLELIIATNACLRNLKVKEVHLFTPYFLGSRSDRDFTEGRGGNNYLKDVICPIINSLNFKTVTCIDPHSDVLEACIKGFRKESNLDLVKWVFMNHPQNTKPVEDFILVSPDAGASKKIYKLAEQIGYKGDVITCSKDRDIDGKLTMVNVPIAFDAFTSKKADFIIIDDICDGGATFINIAKNLKNRVKGKIYLIVTHGIFSKSFGELSQYFDNIYCTNSYKDIKGEASPQYVKQLNVFL